MAPEQNSDKIMLAAKYFVKKSKEDPEKGLDALKLQKLLYYTKAWGMVLKNRQLFPDQFQAWVHGPANPKVWQAYREFDFAAPHPEIVAMSFDEFNKDEKEVLENIWNVYGKFDGRYLEALTHTEEPWLEARRGLEPSVASQNVISDELMKQYYEQRFAEATPTSN